MGRRDWIKEPFNKSLILILTCEQATLHRPMTTPVLARSRSMMFGMPLPALVVNPARVWK